MREGLLVVVLVGSGGCVVPRSMVVGQLAAPVGRGATEVAVFGGVLYGSQVNPPTTSTNAAGDPVTSQATSRALAAPLAEANVQYGFSEHLGLNLHASSAGIQPGLKWTINRSKVAHVALLPALAVGYGSVGTSTLVRQGDGLLDETNPGSTTSFVFLGGLKVLFSHRSGFYAGVGYDFLYHRSFTGQERNAAGDRTATLSEVVGHQVTASVGFDVRLGFVRLRPEIAFAVYPGLTQTITTQVGPSQTSAAAGGGFGWAIFPGFSIAVVSPGRELSVEEKEEERTRTPKRRKSDPDDEDDDELEGRDRRRDDEGSRRRRSEEEEEDRPRSRGREEDDELD